MRRVLFLFILLAQFYLAKSQQDPQFSQYMFNVSYWTPSLTAIDGTASIYALSRSQWVGYDGSFDQSGGAPSTQFLNYSMPVALFNTTFGVGGTILYDRLGPSESIQIQLPVSHHFDFPRGTLSVGLRPVINNSILNFGEIVVVNPNDPVNLQTKESEFNFDLDAGVSYSTENFIVGVGAHHLLMPTISYGLREDNGAAIPRQILYNIYGEFEYVLNYKLSLSPSVLIQSDINSYAINVGGLVTYSGKLWGGLSYRYSESMVFILGYSFFDNNSLSLGYSFDYIINDQEVKSATSHEFYIRYNLPKFESGNKKIIRTPRFRF